MRYNKIEINFFKKNGFKKDCTGEYYYSTGIVVKGDHADDIADLRLSKRFLKREITYFSSLFDTCFIECLMNGQEEKELKKDYQIFVSELNKKVGTNFKLRIKKGTPIIYEPIDIATVDFNLLREKFERFIILMDKWLTKIFWSAIEEGHHNYDFKTNYKIDKID